ncbi:MAG: MBL fold hydrolase [Desulfobacterales bacterium]|nr:MAG: MBL fold hydrolase [Desulfobacterales bacterium]
MKLDGGSMFGNAPKALWTSWMPADDQNMIDIASKSLLVQTPNHTILFETGAGAYLSPEMKQRFHIIDSHHVLLDGLAQEGLTHTDISHVVLSHLHFDHAGGLLSEWSTTQPTPELLFPNARFIVGETHFKRAVSPHFRDRASFIPQLPEMLEGTGRLDLQQEDSRLNLDGVEITFFESHGHTPGMLISWIRIKDRTFIYTGDLIPGHSWINLPITMGFDRFPEALINEKKQLLDQAMDAGAQLIFPHDPQFDVSGLKVDTKKKRIMPADKVTGFHLTL